MSPRNVRLRLADGREVPCELVYEGRNEQGVHQWAAVTPVGVRLEDLSSGRAGLAIDMMPAKTVIRVQLALIEEQE